MTRETANESLYLVALFSFLSLLSTILTSPVSFPILIHDKAYFAGSFLFIIFQLLLIAAAFLKDNRFLFLMIPVAYMSGFFEGLVDFVGYFF